MSLHMPALVLMGVSGCGKSSVAAAVAAALGIAMIEGDALHPPQNIAKMSAGTPLDDQDRYGWLARVGETTQAALHADSRVVVTCSALKRLYRDQLRAAVPGLGFVYLSLSRDEAWQRLSHRRDHFMPASLIDSQFATLEVPEGEAGVLTLAATTPIDELATRIVTWWNSANG